MAGGSSHAFEAESPDECARAVTGVTPQSILLSLLSSLLILPQNQVPRSPVAATFG